MKKLTPKQTKYLFIGLLSFTVLSIIIYFTFIRKATPKLTGKPSITPAVSHEAHTHAPETSSETITTADGETINATKTKTVSATKTIPIISGTLLFEKGQMYTTDDLTSKTSCTHEGGLFGVTKYFYITQQWQPVNENGPSNTLLAAADKSDESPYEFTNKDIYNSGTFFVPKGIIMSGCLLFEDDDKIIRPNVKAAFNRIWFDRDVYAKSGFSYTTKEVPSEFTTIWTDPQGKVLKTEKNSTS